MSNIYRRGENVFLYVNFKDEDGNFISVTNPQFKIISEKDEDPSLIDWEDLIPLSSESNNSEYYCNYIVPHNSPYGTYEIVYKGNYLNKVARIVESIRVIPTSNVYENTIKVYGYVNQEEKPSPIQDVFVQFVSEKENEIVYEARTNFSGYWEAHVYPEKYIVYFYKYGLSDAKFNVQIGNEHNEIQFNNVIMELSQNRFFGNGIYRIFDKYITKDGLEIFGIDVRAYNVSNISEVVAENKTNKDGEWELFLNPGTYMLHIDGSMYDIPFKDKFRLRVGDDGSFYFENLSSNVAVTADEVVISPGDRNDLTNIEVTDVVVGRDGYPIVDVQVNVFVKGNLSTIIAQSYTNPSGTWTVYIKPGTYIFEFYHPEFDVIMEERKIN